MVLEPLLCTVDTAVSTLDGVPKAKKKLLCRSFIFYTGKRTLVLRERPKSPRVKVILGRPDLEDLIHSIVNNVNSRVPMDSQVMERAREAEREIYDKTPMQHFCDALERALVSHTFSEMHQIAIDASEPVGGHPAVGASLAGFIHMVRTVCNFGDLSTVRWHIARMQHARKTPAD